MNLPERMIMKVSTGWLVQAYNKVQYTKKKKKQETKNIHREIPFGTFSVEYNSALTWSNSHIYLHFGITHTHANILSTNLQLAT